MKATATSFTEILNGLISASLITSDCVDPFPSGRSFGDMDVEAGRLSQAFCLVIKYKYDEECVEPRL